MESKANKEDKDKRSEAEMEESFVNNSDKSSHDKKQPDVTRRESNQTQQQHDEPTVKQPKISEAMIKELEEQNFIKLVSKLKNPEKYGNFQFYCEVCPAVFEKINDVKQHISGRAHKKNKKAKGPILMMKRIPQPSPKQIEALGTMLEVVVQQHGLDPDKDLNLRLQVKAEIQVIVQSHISGSSLTLYGSSLTCFGFKTSDVNLDLTLPEGISAPQGLLTLLEVLQRNDKCINVKDEFDLNTPQISFIHKKSGLTCNLSCGSKMVCKTSELLKHYSEINPVVHKLVVGFRFWAQSCCIDRKSDGGLAPYCFALMVIQFLQCTNPPLLPRLNVQEEISRDKLKSNTSNTASLGLLWFKLFRFYCVEFEIDENVISIRVKQPFSRETRRWGHRRFAIEDPYMTGHNVSTVNSDKVFDYIMHCMETSFVYFGTVPKGFETEITPGSMNEPAPTPKGSRPSEDSDDVEVYEETGSDEDGINHKSRSEKAGSKIEELESNGGGGDDDIFQMDDLEDREGVAVRSEEGAVKTKDRDKEITGLQNRMKNLALINQKDASHRTTMDPPTEMPAASNNKPANKTSKNNIAVYKFEFEVLAGGRKPEVQCQVCKKDGHSSSRCPDLRKPSLTPLPTLSPRMVDLVTDTCSKAKDLIAFGPEQSKFRESVLWNLEEYIQEVFPDAQLHLFGSSMNGFGFKDSDLDICMTLEGKCKEDIDCINIINQLAKKLKQHRDCGNVVAITTAKVPIVKFYLRSVKKEADISLYNVLALENTKMLATYARLDDRVAILGFTLKLFAKVCDIGDASKGSLSSYAYILMLLHFLQKRDPPVIPVLQELYEGDTQPRNMIDGWNCWFYSDIQTLSKVWKPKMPNKESVGSLWIGFLRYFTETFDWEHEVVCCRRSKRLTKFERMWTRHVFAVEDPFNLDHNLGAGISRKMGTFIRNALARGRERFGYPPAPVPYHQLINYYFHVDFLTNGCDAPSDRTCRVCGHIGHIARECPRLKRNRKEENRSEERSKLSNRPFAQMNASPRRRAATAPIMITRKEAVKEKTAEHHLAESLPNDALPKGAMKASDPTDGIKKESIKATGYNQAFPELPLKHETIHKEKEVMIQAGDPGSVTSKEPAHPQVSQASHSRNDPGAISQVGAEFSRVSTPPLPSSVHTDTSSTSINPHASNSLNQGSPRPIFGPVGGTPLVNPGLPANSVPYRSVQLIPPEKFMSPPKSHFQPLLQPLLQPFLSPQHLPGQVPDEGRMLPQHQPIHVLPGYAIRPPSENTINAWPPPAHLGALYQSSMARNIPGQPRERPRSVSESNTSPGAHHEHRVPPTKESSPPAMMIGSPPQVFRNYQDVAFWGAVGLSVNSHGLSSQNVGSTTRHPSSLPSNFPMPHPDRSVGQFHPLMQKQQQQQQQVAAQTSSPQPRPVMLNAHRSNMSPEVFFNMVKEAEKQQQAVRQPQNNQEIGTKIPSSDAVLSHPVAAPIFRQPKTADEKELFSKLDKVRGLWTSIAPETQMQSGDVYIKAIPNQERENTLKEQVKANSQGNLVESHAKEIREMKNATVSLGSCDQDPLPLATNKDDSTRAEANPMSLNAANNQQKAYNLNERKDGQPSTLAEDMKKDQPLKGTENTGLKQQLDDDAKTRRNSKDKTRQKQQSSSDTVRASKKKQGLLGDKPVESLASGKKRQEIQQRPNKNMDTTDSSSSISLPSSESENALFDLSSYQKAFPTGDVVTEAGSDRGDGSAPQPKPNKKQNRNKNNGRNGQESRNIASSSQVLEYSPQKGNKKGRSSEEGVSSPGGPAPKRRKSKEGLPTDSRSTNEEIKEKSEKSVEHGEAIEATQRKVERETPSKNSRAPKDNRNRRKQRKGTPPEDKPESLGDVPTESNVAQTQQGKKAADAAGAPKTPQPVKEDKTRGKRKQSKDSIPAGRTSTVNTTGTSSPVQMPPKKGERSATPSKTTRETKGDSVGGQEQGGRGVNPVEKKESPTSRSEDSGEDSRGGNGGPKRKSKGRGRGRGRGRGKDTQCQPGPVSDGKTRSADEKHKGSQEPRK